MSPLFWTDPALADLRRIGAWLTGRASPDVAVDILSRIGERSTFLTRFPQGGRAIAEHGFRVLRVTGTAYLIVYRIGDERIELLRIRHERENWQVER